MNAIESGILHESIESFRNRFSLCLNSDGSVNKSRLRELVVNTSRELHETIRQQVQNPTMSEDYPNIVTSASLELYYELKSIMHQIHNGTLNYCTVENESESIADYPELVEA